MKKVFLARHAKSSWDHPNLSDVERPLNKRGMLDAELMAEVLKSSVGLPDKIICSCAARARITAQLLAEGFGMPTAAISVFDELYESTPQIMIKVLRGLSDKWTSVMLVAHNPGITDFLNEIKSVSIDNVPTGGIGIISFKADRWRDITLKNAELHGFEYPSRHRSGKK